MTKRATSLLLAAFLLAACGGSTEPSIEMDGKAEVAKGDAKDAKGEVCTLSCEGRECGTDGCEGTCGTCDPWLTCDEVGQCVAPVCVSSKDCPGELVCNEGAGQCVVCVQDGDCDEGETCGADHLCHGVVACTSDKDCKDYDMLCDLDAGVCVQCLKSAHCAEDEYCQDSYCLPDVCTAEESWCEEKQVLVCSEDGGAVDAIDTCGADQYCEEAACHDFLCEPAAIWCDADVLKTCSEDGKAVVSEVDCSAGEQHCFDGQCIDSVCVPEGTKCSDDFTVGVCDADGMGFTQELCPGQHFCEKGACMPWECAPSEITCEGAVVVTCDYKGKKVEEVDCEADDQVCVDGSCLDLACAPEIDFCVDNDTVGQCAEDGLTFESSECPAQHSCSDGQCAAWVCIPQAPICDGTIATVCAETGLGPASGGTDCEPLGKFCVDGECIDCEPQCVGKECGPDGCGGECGQCEPGQECIVGVCPPPGMDCDDGNDVDWDGCSGGQISEFQMNTTMNNHQQRPRLAALADGRFVVTWKSQAIDGSGWGVFGQLFELDGTKQGSEFQVNSWTAGAQDHNAVAALADGGFVVVWQSHEQDGDQWGIYGQRFNQAGEKTGAEFAVNAVTQSSQNWPSVAALTGGGFVVTWTLANDSEWHYDVVGRLFDSSGEPEGSEFDIHMPNVLDQTGSEVSGLPSGGMVVVWTGVVSEDKAEIFAATFAADGTVIIPEFMVNGSNPNSENNAQVAVTPTGAFLVAWQSWMQDGSKWGVFGRLFSADGVGLPTDMQLNEVTGGPQILPCASAISETMFAVAWQQGASGSANVCFRIVDANAPDNGEQAFVHSFMEHDQANPDVATLGDGTVFVVWESDQQDGGGHGIFGQRFDADGNKLYH